VIVVAACGSDKKSQSKPGIARFGEAATRSVDSTQAVSPAPGPASELLFVDVNRFGSSFFLRFVARIRNLAPYPVEAARVQWVAKDPGDAIVGAYEHKLWTLPPSGTVTYVGGAGSFSGQPSTVELKVLEAGRRAERMPAELTVRPAIIIPPDSSLRIFDSGRPEYRSRQRSQLATTRSRDRTFVLFVVLKDAAGNIVGGDFEDSPEALPEHVPPHTKFRTRDFCDPGTSAASRRRDLRVHRAVKGFGRGKTLGWILFPFT